MALILINSVDNDAYTMARYHLEDMRELTLSHTKERLKLVEQRIKDETTQSGETANRAGGKGKGKEKQLCFHCDKPGHIKIKCYKWLATDKGKKYTKSHPVSEEKPVEEAKQSTQNSTSRDQTQKNRGKNSSTKKKKSRSARAAQESNEDDFDNAWMARETVTERDLPMTWIINSGASRHMTPNESIFTSKQSVQTTVTVANGEKLHAQGVGDVKVNINSQSIRMKDVLYVPDLDANLLSISALNQMDSACFSLEVKLRSNGRAFW